jgi:hypothetical protein
VSQILRYENLGFCKEGRFVRKEGRMVKWLTVFDWQEAVVFLCRLPDAFVRVKQVIPPFDLESKSFAVSYRMLLLA